MPTFIRTVLGEVIYVLLKLFGLHHTIWNELFIARIKIMMLFKQQLLLNMDEWEMINQLWCNSYMRLMKN